MTTTMGRRDAKRPTILYIEDNPENRMLVRSVLTPAGYTVHDAEDGLAGIEAALREPPALILLDINLPTIDGYEVVAVLRSLPQLAGTPVVAVTAYSMPGDRQRTLVAGCDGYIQKPIDVDELPKQIEEFLHGKRERLAQSEEGTYLRELNQHLVYRLLQRVEELKRVNGQFMRRASQLEALHAAMRDVTSELDQRTLLEQLLPALGRALGTRRLTVELAEPEGLRVEVEGTEPAPSLLAAATGTESQGWTEVEWRTPLTARGHDLGVMSARYVLPPGAAGEEEQLLKIVANQVATCIENSRLYERMKAALRTVEESQRRIVQGERLRALGEMAGGVAHDFNNILAIIIARAEVLSASVDDPTVQRQLDVIVRAALDGTQTVKRIQEFTRIRRARDFHVVDLNQLIVELRELTRSRWKDEAEAKGIRYELRLETSPVPAVQGNPSEIREALTNILFNALDSMPTGGTVTFLTGVEEGRVVCSIADTGIGMPDDVRQRVFDPFFTTKGERGTGLGLSVVYGIVTRHGGEIDVRSRVGAGSTFTLRLPISKSSDVVAGTVPTPGPSARTRVLIVDDEPEVRSALRDLLVSDGHSVVACTDGESALEAFEEGGFDLVITDLGMAGLSGWDVTRLIKERSPGTPVAMITGWSDRIDPGEAERHGIEHVIAKPFRRDDLRRVVTAVTTRPDRVSRIC